MTNSDAGVVGTAEDAGFALPSVVATDAAQGGVDTLQPQDAAPSEAGIEVDATGDATSAADAQSAADGTMQIDGPRSPDGEKSAVGEED
jgi:hypothetical protein